MILAIDTSCDETAAAVTAGRRVLSNIVWSQIETHKPWGGIVPDLAKREHKKYIDKVITATLKRAKISFENLDAVAVTQGPGLAIALEVGINKAKEIAHQYKKPLIAINHMEGHLLSPFALNSKGNGPFARIKPQFPLLGLLVSGGHTQLVLMKNFGRYQLLGETLDDAAGEAFDKVAKMLNLGYPGGPIISEFAKKGNPKKFNLPVPMAKNKSLNFSFSGLKTACLYKLRKIPEKKRNRQFFYDFAASFERVLVRSIVLKLKLAMEKFRPRQILLGGGVINNLHLRQEVRKAAKKYRLACFIPYSKKLFTDNAAMIGVVAFYRYRKEEFVSEIERKPSLSF